MCGSNVPSNQEALSEKEISQFLTLKIKIVGLLLKIILCGSHSVVKDPQGTPVGFPGVTPNPYALVYFKVTAADKLRDSLHHHGVSHAP